MITAHTDVVGSLLRPPALRHAGTSPQTQFKQIQDTAEIAETAHEL